ncbi:MAG: YebC/PmpR family DNA-binding transcriptional regulator [Armatimonadota bacterium]|nr:YebC/PmpR family DNA-binding transcriptional regulator [Armatimonadota bacterium]MDR7449106.1 YebC/PmpR family DNA-binding transcriptional regulator [Armatimonadota bacterium]MDR7459184.1 YebC/PmpR family DNA-binding transcriptional regulator [Armatimonadota bacterium]MDR7480456.1 YebC/PmpR family DNA-binding transcriptional regulator [Armatimonadota bacterium]MDR7489216.1 YebC/PmpR family DNA-binding transcriptional regulator [Armatimonadota bacterium]
MSGHSKWHNIRIKKQKMDQVRGRLFSRLSREITVAAKEGGGNPEANLRLRAAIERARDAGMPNENIQRAIQRGTGEGGGAALEVVVYEGYGPGGVAVLVEALTDNRNRTASEIRAIFRDHGGRMSEVGSVAWMFDRKGSIVVDRTAADEDAVITAALEGGAEDVRTTEDSYEIVTAPEDLYRVKQALEARAIPVTTAEISMVPKSLVHLEGREAQQVLRLLEALEEHDDVQRAYANFDIPEEILQQVG